jgi:hypothetical protein
MNLHNLIAPTDLRDYAKAKGWALLREADRLYVMSNSRYENRQLVFPMDTTAPDFADAVMLVVDKLATMESRTREAVIKSLLEVGDDGMFAGAMIQGAQQMLLASACTVLKPQSHHPRLNRTEAQQFLETARFRHTQPGSFVLNVSCPVQALDVQASLLPEEAQAPFVRRATFTFRRSLSELVSAIETDSLAVLIDTIKKSPTPLISSNFCEGLARFEDDSLKNSVEINIAWAASIPRPPNEPEVSVVRIQQDYFSRIEEVRRELRSAEKHTDDTFIGTVERLDGDMGADGHRSGEIILSLLLPEGEQVRARTNLNAENYEKADKAHMTEGVYVKVAGQLNPGRQPRQLVNLRSFELIEK